MRARMIGKDQRAAAAERFAVARAAEFPILITIVDLQPGAAELHVARMGACGYSLDADGHVVGAAMPATLRTVIDAIGACESVYPGRFRFHLRGRSTPWRVL